MLHRIDMNTEFERQLWFGFFRKRLWKMLLQAPDRFHYRIDRFVALCNGPLLAALPGSCQLCMISRRLLLALLLALFGMLRPASFRTLLRLLSTLLFSLCSELLLQRGKLLKTHVACYLKGVYPL
ncbi:hypothetical protein [Mycetohabitans endofungorum]|uniref:hypothetical protein n=1 Tax=Mycetohabitans endofungorum TaxID=417203 RepID=UPI001E5004C5|nr:hypothetical protein [Mycetohabitans endofungorum]